MTEYVIKEVSQSLWMVFADRRSICACADENNALRLMAEHSAAKAANISRLRNCADETDAKNPPA
jgi:hypothetical protein